MLIVLGLGFCVGFTCTLLLLVKELGLSSVIIKVLVMQCLVLFYSSIACL